MDKFKEQFVKAAAVAFRKTYPDIYKDIGEKDVFDEASVAAFVEAPKDPSMGRFALPVFRFVKLLKEKPQDISAKIAKEVNGLLETNGHPALVKCEGVSGFINVKVDSKILTGETIKEILTADSGYASSDLGTGKKVLVEYSSPNIAKPFGVGHLRSTVIGHSLRRIFKKLGYDVTGINYPGDWGTQFGKMIVAYKRWGSEKDFEGTPIENLLRLYVKYHVEVEKDTTLDDAAREEFQKLESGDPETVKLWEKFKDISQQEFDLVYGMLGVDFDLVIGESFLNDKMEPVVERLKKAGLTEISEGALVVPLKDDRLPPVLLKKKDGSTLYATRDLAGLIYRWDKYHFDESLYVVGSQQSDYFRQLLMVIEMLEDAEKIPPDKRMTGKVKHIEFGWVKFEGKAMSTRQGKLVFLKDVLNQAMELAQEKIREKNPDLENIEETAHLIGVGAVLYSQLSVRRHKDVNFIWEDVLNFEGETGPYLQYTHARLRSLMRNYEGKINSDIDFTILDVDEENRVVEMLADFPDNLTAAAKAYDPYVITSYLIKLAGAFNKVYQRKDENGRIVKIISDDTESTRARIALVKAVQLVLKEGLYLLGIEAPEEM